jgi:hypothetical protein
MSGYSIGYARTSTEEQQAGLEAQVAALRAAGCKKVLQERVSSIGQRKELETALGFVREGDTFVVTKLDRLARSTQRLRQSGTLADDALPGGPVRFFAGGRSRNASMVCAAAHGGEVLHVIELA